MIAGSARALRRLAALVGLVVASGVVAGCALLSSLPKPTTLADRLDVFPTQDLPLDGDVTIHWNEHQVPFIEAGTDGDAAFALGLVHAHLRLGQLGLVRMIAQGRLAEMAGPMAADIDRGLRILSYGRAAGEIEGVMDAGTRRWVQRFVDGINHYQETSRELPHEYRVLGLEPEPWTIADVLTIGRLAGTDVNWFGWTQLLPLRARDDWPELWARLVEQGTASLPSFDGGTQTGLLEVLGELSRSGSNSLVLAPSRTTTGGAVIASDPHLGIRIPNMWLVAGVKSPSYHVVGLMGPGLPLFAVGRTPDIAWGGTNMRASSSDLYDVSGLPASEFTERTEAIAVRWWFDEEVTVRETPLGPVISDVPLFRERGMPPAALKWSGHQASDEIGAMLAVSRARDFEEFRSAFERFAVPGQNMLYADRDGNVGQVMAARLPRRDGAPDDMVLDPDTDVVDWTAMHTATSLPYSLNPGAGFLASANNRPTASGMPVGFFFSRDDRIRRLTELVGGGEPLDLEAVMALQRDVYMESAAVLRDLFVAGLDSTGLAAAAEGPAREALGRLRGWDGHYRVDSVGAVTFEQFRHGFKERFYPLAFGEEEGSELAGVERLRALLPEDIEAADPEAFRGALAAGLDAAAAGLDTYSDWSDMHRLSLAHPFEWIPVLGKRYRFAEYGVGGSTDTLMKTAHSASPDRHSVFYGANARHVSDMSDVDANHFVLLGGQDGWLNSSTKLDQWPLWRDGDYMRMPLSLPAVRQEFSRKTVLTN